MTYSLKPLPQPDTEESGHVQARPVDARGRLLHDLRISVIDRCNFRCPYCMPEDEYPAHHDFLARDKYISFDEIERLARIFVELGVRKIRITGGEPLLRRNLDDLVARLAVIAELEDIALTTNGVLLEQRASKLAAAGLKRVTVSLDSVDEDVFARMSGGRRDLQRVLDGIDAAAGAGLGPIKINAVVKRDENEGAIMQLLAHFRHTPHIVRLIEYMDVGTENQWQMRQVVPSREIIARISTEWPLIPLQGNYRGEVARRYRYADGAGEIGFISSVTEPFCGACSRARLSTDGLLYTCLFAQKGTDLKPALRSGNDEELRDFVRGVWIERGDRYSETRSLSGAEYHPLKKVEMYRIGG